RPPFKFAIKHRRKLGMRNLSNGQLHVPNGAVFEVGLTRRKDRKFLWFKRRWMIFMEENSVKEDFLLTFEYVHHSRFNVRIFKKSATVLYLSLIFETEQEWTAVEKDLVEKEIPVVLKFHQRFCNMSTRMEELEIRNGDIVNLRVPGVESDGFKVNLEISGASMRIASEKWIMFYDANGLKNGNVCHF
ncbi:hypothetical protein LINPERPRIM_LOCUS2362, partial [Linum perenne]